MQSVPIPANEKERLMSLYELGLLDTAPEERFDRITSACAEIFNVPISTLTLIDAKREWFKSVCGLDKQEGDRAISFCGHALLSDDVLVVPDTTKDERFKDNPMVVGEPFIRFYAGVPIKSADGTRAGVLCIKDKKSRKFSAKESSLLKSIASWAELEINSRNLSIALEHGKTLSEELETFFNTTQDLMCIATTDGYFQKINQMFRNLLGYSEEVLLKEPFLSFIHPDDQVSTLAEVAKLSKGAPTINFVNRYRAKDGTYYWLQWNASPHGTRIFATARNISAIREAEIQRGIQQERLEQISRRFVFATESAKIGIWEWDVINNRLTWDDQMYALYGIEKDKFGGAYEAWQAGLHPDDKKPGDDAIQQALAGEKEFDTFFRVIWPDKSVHYIKAYGSVERDTGGVPQKMVGVNWDVTVDKIEELKLKQFEAIIRDTDEAIISKTLDGTVTGWNNGAEKLYGYTQDEMIGKSIRTIIPDDHDDLDLLLNKVSKGERILNYATLRKRKDGSLIDVLLTISPICSDEGFITGVSVVARDITKEKIIDKEKTEFVSLASHQLKTPVGAVQWNLEMLLAGDYGSISKKQADILKETYVMNSRMNELINGLLNISRIEMGVFVIEPVPTDFAKLCDEVIGEMEPRRLIKGHQIQKGFSSNLPKVPADPKLLRIVFQNFISNAIKYTPNNGKILIKIKTDDKNITFSVANNGAPIPEKDQSKIFQKLFRASNAAEQDTDGNGLGLYIVKHIVVSGGGRIWFTSREGENTVFFASFPLSGMIPKSGTKPLS